MSAVVLNPSETRAQALLRLPFDLTGANGTVATGASDQFLAASVAAGDINGDGRPDLVLGKPGDNSGAGGALVVFGQIGNFPFPLEETALLGSGAFEIEGVTADDFAGFATAALDFNGDGLDDVAVGARAAMAPGLTNAGQVYIVFGSTNPFPASISPVVLNGANGLTLNGSLAGDYASAFLARVPDMNGDGVDELAVGSIDNEGPLLRSGKAWVVFGVQGPTPASINLGTLDGANGMRVTMPQAGAQAGRVAGGDVNGDGLGDLIVGAPRFDAAPGQTNNGRAHIIFGSTNPFPATLNLAPGALNGANGFTVTGEDGDYVGYFSAVDDFDGDGWPDVALGAPAADNLGALSGKVFILRGRPGPYPPNFLLPAVPANELCVLLGNYAGEYVGFHVSAPGDVNGDGLADLLVGHPGSPFDGTFSGRATLFHGANPLPPTFNVASVNGVNGVAFGGISNSAQLGFSTSGLGDINGDGGRDFAIAAPSRTVGSAGNAGEVYVLYGTPAPATGSTGGATGGDTGGSTGEATAGSATGAATTGSGATSGGATTAGDTGGGTGAGSATGSTATGPGTGGAASLARLPWKITIQKPKAAKTLTFVPGKRGLGTVKGNVEEPDLDRGTDGLLVELSLLRGAPSETDTNVATNGTLLLDWVPATKVGKVNKKGRFKFKASKFAPDLDLVEDDPLILRVRASTNFAAATTQTATVAITVKTVK